MNLKNLIVALILISAIFMPLDTNADADAKGPILVINNCQVPYRITEKIRQGVQFAIDNQAAFMIDHMDLFHVHLLIKPETHQKILQRDRISSLELMNYTEAMLFHSQEHYGRLWDFFPPEVRKRRNIFFDLLSNDIGILNTDEYPVDPEHFTIWQDKDLGFVETFQVSFARVPDFLDKKCRLSTFELRVGQIVNQKTVITSIMGFNIREPARLGKIVNISCSCSGGVR